MLFFLSSLDFSLYFSPFHFSFARIGLPFTHNNGDFGAISVTESSCALPISEVESQIAILNSFCVGTESCPVYSVNIRGSGLAARSGNEFT